MADRKDDQALNDYLQGNSELSRRYRSTAKNHPPQHVDDAILAAARKSVGSRPRPVRAPFLQKWGRPLSIAAVLVVCVSLVFTIYDEQEQQFLTAPEVRETLPDSVPLEVDSEQFRSASETGDSDYNTEGFMLDKTGNASAAKSPSARKEQPVTSAAISRENKQTDTRDVLRQPAKRMPTENRLEEESLKLDQDKPVAAMKEKPVTTDATVASMVELEVSVDEWLDEIDALWQADKKEEAINSLERFMEAHPDYPEDKLLERLPEDLDPDRYIEIFESE